MKVTVLALGSRGDVQPLVALGIGLKRAGLDVCINTHAPFYEMVQDAGLEFCLIETNPVEVLESDVGRAVMEGGSNPLRQMQDFSELMHPHMLNVGADSWAACREAEALLYAQVSWYFGPHIAERLSIPAIATYLHPEYSNGEIPGYSFPIQRDLGGPINRFTWVIEDAMSWYPLRPVINQWRQEELNLPPIPRRVIHQRYLRREKHPTVFGFSPSVFPKPAEWGDHIDVTGYWFLEASDGWEPPQDLLDFLAAGPPPVYVGFGSMSTRRSKEITEIILQSLIQSGERGLLAKGWGGLSEVDLPENLFEIESAPHTWLFPQMAAAVHHGGAGTTAASLRAGIPTAIIPFWADQPFWGQRVYELGAGPVPIPQKELTVDRLAEAIKLMVSDRKMQIQAKELGRKIQAEDGIGRAAEFIRHHLISEMAEASAPN